MNTNNILQKITKYFSIAGLSLSIFNTITNQTTIQSLRESLDLEKDKNSKLISEINNLANKDINNNKLEEIITNQNISDSKLSNLNNKINQIIENKSYDESSISDVDNRIREINNDLLEIINKIDESLNNNFIGIDVYKIFNIMQSYISSLNYFQSLALSHLFGFMFIILSLISLISLYFGDYLIIKFNIEEKYPNIYKYIKLRRTFQRFYLILDITIIFIILIILSILDIMLFINFTL